MILVDIKVPALMQTYDFQIDENTKVRDCIQEIAEIICHREHCSLAGNMKDLWLWSCQTKQKLNGNYSLHECGINSGDTMILV